MKNRQLFRKLWLLLVATVMAATTALAQTVNVQVTEENQLWDALEAEGITDFSTVKSLKVTGPMGEQDFLLIKNLMTGLEDVDLSDASFTDMPESVFQDRETLKSCRLPETLTRINHHLFQRCRQLTSVSFGNQEAVAGHIVFPAAFSYVGGEAFDHCWQLTHLDFSSCTNFGTLEWNAFSSCYGLVEVLFPSEGSIRLASSVFSLDEGTMNENDLPSGLQTLTLTKAVSRMEGNCLPNWLKTLYVERTTPAEINDDTFDNIDKDQLTIYVPKGTKRSYALSNGWTKVYTRMQELGFLVGISGEGCVQMGNRTYADGGVCFPVVGQPTTLQIVPAAGYEVTTVTLDGTVLSPAADGTLTIPAETISGTLNVVFARKQLQLAVSVAGQGSVTIAGNTFTADGTYNFEGGTSVDVQLTPADGYFVKSVTLNDEALALKDGSTQLTLPALNENGTLSVVFANDATAMTTVTFSQEGVGDVLVGGTVFGNGSTLTVEKGSSMVLTFVTKGDSRLDAVTVNGTDVLSELVDNTYTLVIVNEPVTVATTFFSSTRLAIDNANGGELKQQIEALGCNPRFVRELTVSGTMNEADWQLVRGTMASLLKLDLTATDLTEIPDHAMEGHRNIQEVIVPQTLKRIGMFAFSNCSSLQSLPLTDRLEEIGDFAFEGSSSVVMDELVMPASLKRLAAGALNGPQITSVDMSRCALSSNIDYYQFSGALKHLKLPEHGSYSIEYNGLNETQLETLTIPACVNMAAVRALPQTLKTIYVQGTSVKSSTDNIEACTELTANCHVYVPAGTLDWYSTEPGWSTFSNFSEYGMLVRMGDEGKLLIDGHTMRGEAAYFHEGDQPVEVEVVPDEGYQIDAVTLKNQPVDVVNNRFTLTADQIDGLLNVTFRPLQYTLQLTISGQGQVALGEEAYTESQAISVDNGQALQFTLQPAEGLVVSHIVFNGEESLVQNGGTTYVTPAITADAALSISFAEEGESADVAVYTFNVGEGGAIEYKSTTLLPQTTINVKKGEPAVFTIRPAKYYTLGRVLFDGDDVTSQVDANNQLTISNVSDAATIDATFRVNTDIAIEMAAGDCLASLLGTMQKKMVTKLTVSGPLSDEDFRTMRDDMPLLADIDLWAAECDYIPNGAFCISQDGDRETGKLTLQRIRLPQHVKTIDYCAFAGCTNLTEVNLSELTELENIGGRAFNSCGMSAVDLSHSRISNLDDLNFRRMPKLQTILLPATLTTLGNAFQEVPVAKLDLSNCVNLKDVRDAFYNCKQLQRVVLPDNIQTLDGTFSECTALTTVNFPQRLRTLGNHVFFNTQITTADLQSLTSLTSIGGYTFSSCRQLQSVTLPSNLQSMGDAFFECSSLKAIDLRRTQLTMLADATFWGCSALESVLLPTTLTTIGDAAFYATKLRGIIELPGSVKTIKPNAFQETQITVIKTDATVPPTLEDSNVFPSTLVAVFVPEGYASAYKDAPVWEDLVILDREVHADITVSTAGNLAIDIMEQAGVAPGLVTHLTVHGLLNETDFAVMRSNMTLLYNLDLSDAEVNMIPDNAFLDKKILMDVKLPTSLLTIQQGAFQGCSSLRGTLTLPQGLKTIGWSAFQGCSSLKRVELNGALEVIRGYAFEGCSSLSQELTFPQGFTSLGIHAFENCRSLYGTVAFNANFYQFIGSEGYWSSEGRAFQNCSGIEAVDFSACSFLDEIPEGTFENCTSLRSVQLPEGLQRIHNHAFQTCTSLSGIQFPSSLQVINYEAFRDCTSLRSIDLSGCPDFGTIEGYAFSGCSSLESANLPKSLNWIHERAFQDCRRLANLTVEAQQPADLGEYVFYHVHTDRCVLSIPTGSFYDYLTAAQWGEFVSMRKSIDVKVGEGAQLTFSSGSIDDEEEEQPAGSRAARARRFSAGSTARANAPAATPAGNAQVKDGSSLYVQPDESVTFYITTEENVSINQVLFNGEDVTDDVVNGAYQTPGVTEASEFEVLLNVDGPISVKELRMTDSEVAILEAESHQIAATVYPSNATDKSIVWTSSDEAVARVSADGKVTGVSAGRATITARTVDGDFEQQCVVIVMSNDYYITLSDAEAFVDNVVDVPLLLHNADNASSIQFDVCLPEGVTMTNESSNFDVSMSGRSNGHTVSAARLGSGAVRVMVYSNDGNAFYDNDGELLTMPISTTDATGEFEVEVKNIHITGPRSYDFTAPDYSIFIRVSDYPLGDSNGNGEVTVTDVANTVEQILEHPTERFIQKAADANSDGQITVSDVTATVGILLGWGDVAGSRSSARRAATAQPAFFGIDEATMAPGGQQYVGLHLQPAASFTALQCDVFLPDGITIDQDDIESLSDVHVVSADKVSNGAVRIVMLSLGNDELPETVDGVLKLSLQAAADMLPGVYDIDIRDVRLVANDGVTEIVAPNVISKVSISMPTGIAQLFMDGKAKVRVDGHSLCIEAQQAGSLRLVSAGGVVRVLRVKPGNNRFYVEQGGVYMLEGRKMIIK